MKTNFQDGSIVTPQFLNAINSPVWKQVPANDGEFKPPALGDMPDVQAAIAGMAQAIPNVCAVDLTACVAVGANGTDVLLSSLLDMPSSKMVIRPVSNYGIYLIDSLLKFNAAATGSGLLFRIKVPDIAFQNRPWIASFLTGAKSVPSPLLIGSLMWNQPNPIGGILMVDANTELNIYAGSLTSHWDDVVTAALTMTIRGLVAW